MQPHPDPQTFLTTWLFFWSAGPEATRGFCAVNWEPRGSETFNSALNGSVLGTTAALVQKN